MKNFVETPPGACCRKLSSNAWDQRKGLPKSKLFKERYELLLNLKKMRGLSASTLVKCETSFEEMALDVVMERRHHFRSTQTALPDEHDLEAANDLSKVLVDDVEDGGPSNHELSLYRNSPRGISDNQQFYSITPPPRNFLTSACQDSPASPFAYLRWDCKIFLFFIVNFVVALQFSLTFRYPDTVLSQIMPATIPKEPTALYFFLQILQKSLPFAHKYFFPASAMLLLCFIGWTYMVACELFDASIGIMCRSVLKMLSDQVKFRSKEGIFEDLNHYQTRVALVFELDEELDLGSHQQIKRNLTAGVEEISDALLLKHGKRKASILNEMESIVCCPRITTKMVLFIIPLFIYSILPVIYSSVCFYRILSSSFLSVDVKQLNLPHIPAISDTVFGTSFNQPELQALSLCAFSFYTAVFHIWIVSSPFFLQTTLAASCFYPTVKVRMVHAVNRSLQRLWNGVVVPLEVKIAI
eukprot:GHVP01058309.1.p1 GENE.GHVP01058309.1~~GHVP01058309.1.p1  ORF type:complete len:470 (-),score=54.11 GHVP01058309.1:196-1605(-)